VSRPNLKSPTFDEPREHPGFTCQRSLLGRQAGGEKTGLSLWSLPPGEAAYPYHWHFATEETIVVLEGAPSLRTPAGWSELAEGDVVCFQAGKSGAHQITNRTDGRVRFLSFSNQQPDAVVYPDSGKLLAAEVRPDGDGARHIFRIADEVDYYEGEEAP
jgi:uncharacterized cupin superfamily protein